MTPILSPMRRLRTFLRRHPVSIIPAILAIAFGLALLLALLPETVRLKEIGFKTLDENAAVQITNYADTWHAAGFALSSDRRWLATRVALDDPLKAWRSDCLFFDLERKRYVASLHGRAEGRRVDLSLHGEWTPDDLPLIWTTDAPGQARWFRGLVHRLLRRPMPSGHRFSFCLADVPAAKARVYFSEPLSQKDAWVSVFPNRSRTAAYCRVLYPDRGDYVGGTSDCFIYDLRRGKVGRARTLKGYWIMIGWMDDDRTLVVSRRDTNNLRLIDAWDKGLVRDIPIRALLGKSLGVGGLAEIIISFDQRSHLSQDRLRVPVGLRSRDDSGNLSDRVSLWDVDLRTGALSHAMDLDWCVGEYHFVNYIAGELVFSPSGEQVLAPVSTATLVTSSIGTSLTLAIASPGQPPRVLPIRVPRFFSNRPFVSGYMGRAAPSRLPAQMAFLDENTLVYRGAGDTLWRYDLRTTAPECLWTPRAGEKQDDAIVSGRVVDTRGRPVADRLVMIVHKDARKSADDRVVVSWKTDASGRFGFRDVPPGDYALEVEAYPGHGLYGPAAQRPKGGVFVLEPGETVRDLVCCTEAPEDRGDVTGRVLDAESEEPIDEFACAISSVDLPGEITPVYGLGLRYGKVAPLTSPIQGHNGAFRIEGVSPGTATLQISKPGYGTERVLMKIESGRTIEPTFRLEREGVLTGRITIGNKPCHYYTIYLGRVGDRTEKGFGRHTVPTRNGDYSYRALKAGDYLFRVGASPANKRSVAFADTLPVRVESGTTTTLNVDFARRSAAIHGRFSAPDKNQRWNVAAFDAATTAAGLSLDDRWRGRAGAIEKTGNYSIDYLAPGTYEIVGRCFPRERKEGQKRGPSLATTKTLRLSDGETAVVDFDLK